VSGLDLTPHALNADLKSALGDALINLRKRLTILIVTTPLARSIHPALITRMVFIVPPMIALRLGAQHKHCKHQTGGFEESSLIG
jgi:hypothetical protein